MAPDYRFSKQRCERCEREFDIPGNPTPGFKCRECTEVMISVNRIIRKLLNEELSLEQRDKQIAEKLRVEIESQAKGIIVSEMDIDELVSFLIKDEARKSAIVAEIKRLQDKKSRP